MYSYAGIGSRSITDIERNHILDISKYLRIHGLTCYSGNANGSDISFQEGSDGKCVIFLPWHNFNNNRYDVSRSITNIVRGDSEEGLLSTRKFHPKFSSLSQGTLKMMNRNHHQIFGYSDYPMVNFVIHCSTDGKGGTAQAVRIANYNGIPCFNIRNNLDNLRNRFLEFIFQFKFVEWKTKN